MNQWTDICIIKQLHCCDAHKIIDSVDDTSDASNATMTDSDSEPKNILSILDQMANSVPAEDTNLNDYHQVSPVSWEKGSYCTERDPQFGNN